jgi:hypothetical protein
MATQNEEWFDIPQAAEELDLSPAYIRLMVRQGVIETKLEPIREGSGIKHHLISKTELMAFAGRDNGRAPRRNDGRRKCVLYALPEELDRIKELLYATHDPGLTIVAQSIQGGKDNGTEYYVPPSKLKPLGE